MKKGIIVILVILIILAGIGIAYYFTNHNKANAEHEIYGTVLKVESDFIQIDVEGNVYNFNIKNASKPNVEITENSFVKLSYKGELEQNAEAIKITIIKEFSSANTTNSETNTTINETNNVTTKNTSNDDNTEHYITGVVTDETMNSITIKANLDGNEYSFNTQNAKKDNGIMVGDTVRIIHKGKVANQKDKQTIDATYVKKMDATNSSAKTISGKVTDISMATLTIEANGKAYTFSTKDANKTSNIILNDTVKVTYKGDLNESSTILATKVEK